MIDIIGKIPKIDQSNPDSPIVTWREGWHINSSEPIPGWTQVTPAIPYRGILGATTYFYRFDTEADANAALAEAGLLEPVNHD